MATVFPNAVKLAALAASETAEFRAHAQRVEGVVRAEAARFRDTDEFASSITMRKGRIDYVISTTHPAAWSIEFGHMAGHRRLGSKRKHVPGLFIFTNAARRAAS